jgi:hypothetical protein
MKTLLAVAGGTMRSGYQLGISPLLGQNCRFLSELFELRAGSVAPARRRQWQLLAAQAPVQMPSLA